MMLEMKIWALSVAVFACAKPLATPQPVPAVSSSDAAIVDAAIPPSVTFPEVGPFRLPHTFEPTGYRARIEIGDHAFTGHIEITGELSEDVSLIWLHGVDLVATGATAEHNGVVVPLQFSGPRQDQLLGLQSKTPLAAGHWTLSIDYSGPIRAQEPPSTDQYGNPLDPPALGMFRRVIGSETYVFTQSEPIYARRIFPCVDEPDRKVPWQLSIDVPKSFIAASNTPVVRETQRARGRKLVEFGETAPLPSYLIAFAAGPFDVVDAAPAKSGTPIRILALHGRTAKVATSARITPSILDALEAWFGIPYRYGKLDLVVVPHSGWGAMENPGLVTFDKDDLESEKSAGVITHELAHQWFGNLVTPSWWDDIWLNESFADFMAAKMRAPLAPSDAAWDEPIARRLGAISSLDREARIRRTVKSTADLEFGKFTPDSIHRGVLLLQLLELLLGPEPFRHAIRSYLFAHANANANSEDLASALTAVAPELIEQSIMRLLYVRVETLEARLLCDGRPRLRIAEAAVEPLRMCVAYDRDGKRGETCADVDVEHLDVPLAAKACPRWVLPNAGGLGLYQTQWSSSLVDALTRNGWPYLSPLEKQLTFGEIDDDVLELDVFAKLANDRGVAATVDEASYVTKISKYVPDDLRPQFDGFVQKRFSTLARAIRFRNDDESPPIEQAQRRVVMALALARDPRLEAEALSVGGRLPDRALFVDLAVTLAANSSTKVRDSLLAELTNRNLSDASRRKRLIEGLSMVRGIVGVFKNDPKLLDPISDTARMFANVCDEGDRKDLADLIHGSVKDRILSRVDECLATKKRLDAGFRKWLATSTRH